MLFVWSMSGSKLPKIVRKMYKGFEKIFIVKIEQNKPVNTIPPIA